MNNGYWNGITKIKYNMEQYINKSALVAEIDKRKIGYNTDGKHTVEYNTVKKILDILDTLEVKEVEEPSKDWNG